MCLRQALSMNRAAFITCPHQRESEIDSLLIDNLLEPPLCPCGIAYRRVYDSSSFESFQTTVCSSVWQTCETEEVGKEEALMSAPGPFDEARCLHHLAPTLFPFNARVYRGTSPVSAGEPRFEKAGSTGTREQCSSGLEARISSTSSNTRGETKPREREFAFDNLLVRIHLIIEIIRRTSLAPWGFGFPFPGSLTSTFLATPTLFLFNSHM